MGLEEDLVEKLRMVIGAVREPQELTLSSGLRMISSGAEVQYSLIGQAITLFDECVDEILRDDRFSGKVSRETVNNRLEDLVAMAIDEDWRERANIQSGIGQMMHDLEENIVPWTFVCPVENLELPEDLTLQVGKVEFFVFNSRAERYYQEWCTSVDRTKDTEEEKTRFKEQFNDYRARLDGKTCAEVIITSEEALAAEIGIDMVERAVNLLRAYAPGFMSVGKRQRAKINLREGQTRLVETSLLYCETLGFSIRSDVVGSLMPFSVNKRDIERLKEKGHFDVVAGCIFAPKTDLERRIARAVQWFGFGSHDTKAPVKVVKYMTGMEALFIEDKKESKGLNIAKRATFLLCGDVDQNERKRTYAKIRSLYECRNAIIHEGCEEVDEQEIDYMEQITILCLIVVAKRTNEWQQLSELIKWVNEQEQIHGRLNYLASRQR